MAREKVDPEKRALIQQMLMKHHPKEFKESNEMLKKNGKHNHRKKSTQSCILMQFIFTSGKKAQSSKSGIDRAWYQHRREKGCSWNVGGRK